MKARRAKAQIVRRTLGYIRVSSESQMDHGVSLDAQRARIAAYCVAMSWPVSEVIDDPGRSAGTLERPGMATILEAVRRGEVERIIVTKLDRLTRSMRDLSDLLDLFSEHDVALVSIGETLDTSTAAGRMMINLLGVFSQWEREVVGERTVAALSHMRKQRQVYGRVPFGFTRSGGILHENPEEQAIKAEAIAMDRNGRSYREIGAMLRERTGRVWGPSSVRAMLRSRITAESAA